MKKTRPRDYLYMRGMRENLVSLIIHNKINDK
nr:MAG TPA: hypothetical protein [Caudoviricetes sp.]